MEPRGSGLIRHKSADYQNEVVSKRILTSYKSCPPALPDSPPPKLDDPLLAVVEAEKPPATVILPPTTTTANKRISQADKLAVLKFLLERQQKQKELMTETVQKEPTPVEDVIDDVVDSGTVVESNCQYPTDHHNRLIGSRSCPNQFFPTDHQQHSVESDVFEETSTCAKVTVRKPSFLKKQSWKERRRQQLSKSSCGYGSLSDSEDDIDLTSSSPTANQSDSSATSELDEGVVAKSVKVISGRRSDSGVSNTSECCDEEPIGRLTKVQLLTQRFSGLQTAQQRPADQMDLAKIQAITDPYELDLMLDEVNDFDTRKAIRKRISELKEPEGGPAELNIVRTTVAMDRITHLPKRSPSAPSSVARTTVTTTNMDGGQKSVVFSAVTPKTFQPGNFRPPANQQMETPQLSPAKPAPFAINRSASSIKDALIRWCQSKTKEYDNVNIVNLSSSWANGLAFCALIHHFHPEAFDYSKLDPTNRAANFDLAFKVAEEYGDIAPLLETEDMLKMGDKPDSKCVFTYVQSFYRRYRETP